jgi:hypothetical protein
MGAAETRLPMLRRAEGQVSGPTRGCPQTSGRYCRTQASGGSSAMKERFERHRQQWKSDELHKLKTLAAKGIALKAIAKALMRSEESVKQRAKEDGLKIAKLR